MAWIKTASHQRLESAYKTPKPKKQTGIVIIAIIDTKIESDFSRSKFREPTPTYSNVILSDL